MPGKQQVRDLLLHISSRATTATSAIAVIFALTVGFAQRSQAQTPTTGSGWTEWVLYSFVYGSGDGAAPEASLIFDPAGNLYGTTSKGGTYPCACGTAFELTVSPNAAGGGWAEQVLHSFGNGADGAAPVANLVRDAAGNLYGTTYSGGTYGYGTVFELTPTAGGGWTETLPYSFCSQTNCTDGANPAAGLIFDAAGNLYGTTSYGGTYSWGTVFELTPTAGGGWTEQVLHSFDPWNGKDGYYPTAGLIFDAVGNLYGTTFYGGTGGEPGTVFELTPTAGGGWTEKVLYSFQASPDGEGPQAGLIFDADGNLYSTTLEGGTYGYGTVFELSPTAGGAWTEKVLHSFDYNHTDGANPYAGVILDSVGNRYGATYWGGTEGHGTVFELARSPSAAGGGWTEQVLHNFGSGWGDGYYPYGGLIFDAAGNLYGTTEWGGVSGTGTVFELIPD